MIHVIPVSDSKPHVAKLSCKCSWRIEYGIVIHDAYDGRLAVECAEELLNNKRLHKQWVVIEPEG